jgi:hypothetical protein
MNTLEFFQTVLPEDGIKYLVAIDPDSGRPKHVAFETLEQMAQAIDKLDQGQAQIYHACASYLEKSVQLDGKKKWRVPTNHNKAKAFWLDIDCGEDKAAEGKGYATKKEAAQALKFFCTTTGLPVPLIVDSGNGLHIYWPLTKAIKNTTWYKIANRFKEVTTHLGLLADPTVTADFARILRPVGSTNKKATPKPVKAVNQSVSIEPEKFAALIKAVPLPEKKKPVEQSNLNDDLIAHLPHSNIPSFAEVIATKCAQVEQMRDSKGDVSYEQWRGVIGLIKFCEEGVEKAVEWSSERANTGHSQVDAAYKYETWDSPPTTCEFFSKCNPSGCQDCQFKGKIKTPLVLGRAIPESKAVSVEAKVDGATIQVEVPPLPEHYAHKNNFLFRMMEDKDGIMHEFLFCNNLFYPIHRIRREDGTFSLGMRMHLPDQRTRDFEIDTHLLASPQKLVEGLARHELVPTNAKDSSMHMTAYLRDSLEKLKREAEELNTYTSFGWTPDFQGFLLGDRLYRRDGSVRKVLIGGYARDMAAAFASMSGSSEGYSKAMNYLYGREGMEPMQYVIAGGFGSVLTPLGDSMYKGLTFAVVGEETAKGKTTVCWSALYAFGDADKMSLKTEDNATTNARYARLGAYKNVPMLLDEITNIDPEEFSKLSYAVSLGQERERLTVGKGNSGVRFAETQTWALNMYVTANKDLHSVLAARQSNTQAEAVRMIQIKIDRYALPQLKMSEVEAAKKQMFINRGAAGDMFLKYVTTNLDNVLDRMARWGVKLETDMPDVKYRFYRNHAICSLSAMEITNELGITNFNLEKLYAFVLELFVELAASVKEQNTVTPEEALNRMLNELSPRILATTEYRDGRDSRGPEDTNKISGGSPAGRYIIGNQNTKDHALTGKLFLIKKEVQDWCLKHRVDHKHMIDVAVSMGVAHETKDKFNVGRGTKVSAGQHRCICIDMLKLEAQGANTPALSVVTNIRMEGSQAANT